MSCASTRSRASASGTVSVSATGVTRSRISASASSIRISGPEKAKQSSLSCAISAPPPPAASSIGAACAQHRVDDRHRHRRGRSPARVACGSGWSDAIGNDMRVVRDASAACRRRRDRFQAWDAARACSPRSAPDRPATAARSRSRQARLRLVAQFMHQRPAARRTDQHLGRAGDAVLIGILAGLVDVEAVMGVLEGRHAQATRASGAGSPSSAMSFCRSRSSLRGR